MHLHYHWGGDYIWRLASPAFRPRGAVLECHVFLRLQDLKAANVLVGWRSEGHPIAKVAGEADDHCHSALYHQLPLQLQSAPPSFTQLAIFPASL